MRAEFEMEGPPARAKVGFEMAGGTRRARAHARAQVRARNVYARELRARSCTRAPVRAH